MLLELVDDMIGDSVALVLGESVLQAANDPAGAHEGVGDRVSKDVSSGHGT